MSNRLDHLTMQVGISRSVKTFTNLCIPVHTSSQQDVRVANDYKTLIDQLTSGAGKRTVTEPMKCHYKNVIDSRRALRSIKTVTDLIIVLEMRDIIHKYDVSHLKKIFEFLQNSEGSADDIKDGNDNIYFYDKMKKPDEKKDGICEVCAAPVEVWPMQKTEEVSIEIIPELPIDNSVDNGFDVLQDAIGLISGKLNGSWMKLGRYLNVKERKLVELGEQLERQEKNQHQIAQEMFNMWLQGPSKATPEDLVSALDHKWVARKDLADELKERYNIK